MNPTTKQKIVDKLDELVVLLNDAKGEAKEEDRRVILDIENWAKDSIHHAKELL
jgi:hypothetical protein